MAPSWRRGTPTEIYTYDLTAAYAQVVAVRGLRGGETPNLVPEIRALQL
jgi:hypothetical protein